MSKKILGLLLKNIYNFGCFRETLYRRFGIPERRLREVRRTTSDSHYLYCRSRVLHIVRQSEVSFVDELKHVVMRRRSWSCVSENDEKVKNREKKSILQSARVYARKRISWIRLVIPLR